MATPMRMNTETGTLTEAGVTGASALVSRVASAMKADVRNTPTGGAEQTDTHVRVEVTQGDTTQVWEGEGRTAVTAEHESITTQRIGTKTAAIALLALTGFNRDHVADTLSAALFDYQEGNPAALAVALGVSEAALEAASDLWDDLARDTVTTRSATPRVYGASVEQVDAVAETENVTVFA